MQTDVLPADWDEAAAGALIAACAAQPVADAYGPAALFAASGAVANDGLVAPLPDLGMLAASGADAVTFLHGQFTNDVEKLGGTEARWYGYCTPQGRLLGLLLGWRDADQIALCTSRTLSAALRKRLSIYVMRSKARIDDRSNDWVLFGLAGEKAASVIAGLGFAAPGPMEVATSAGLTLVGLAPAQLASACPRWLLAAPAQQAAELWQALAAELAPASSEHWRWLDVRAATPRIVAATGGHYLPQTLNLDLSGGVDFQKGCYPGQEVVARTHYRSTAKRRMYRGQVAGAEPQPLADVALAGSIEPVGTVIMAAPCPGGGAELLLEAQTSAVGQSLAPGGARLQVGGQEIALELLFPADAAS